MAELLGVWEASAKKMEKDGASKAAQETRVAISVLEQTYTAEEMGISLDPDLSYEEKSD